MNIPTGKSYCDDKSLVISLTDIPSLIFCFTNVSSFSVASFIGIANPIPSTPLLMQTSNIKLKIKWEANYE